VQVLQHITDLLCPLKHLCFGQWPLGLLQNFFQGLPFYEGHDQVQPPVLGEIPDYLGQVGVIEGHQDPRFLLELLPGCGALLWAGEAVQELFDRPPLAEQARIFGKVDGTHASDPKNPDDPELALQDYASRQRGHHR